MMTQAIQDLRITLLRVIESLSAGLLLIALAADLLAADARFNQWVSTVGKRKLGDDAMLKLIEMHEDVTTACQQAVDEFELTNDDAALNAVLTDSLRRLQEATTQNAA